MNPKIIGIVLLIVGLGVGLYFINSGGASKIGEILKTPGSSNSTSSTIISGVATSSTAQPAASSSGFSWSSFFSSLFAPHTFKNLPTIGTGNAGGSGGYITNPGSSGGSNASGSSGPTPPTGFTAAQLSPYYRKVIFSDVSSDQIGLTTYPVYNETTSSVDITGWEIKTNRGGEYIPQAVDIYNPESANPESDIVLTLQSNQPQYVNIFSNSAPVNLRVNDCMGYLNKPQQFNPGFSYDCPAPDRSQISQLTGVCQNYIASLNGCQSPDFNSYYFPRNDYQCEDYLAGKYNYNWCIDTYASTPDFLGDEWRIWMGSSPLDPYHDIVELLDQNGLLVDMYSY